MLKKTNPHRRPATQADVKRAKQDAQNKALSLAIVLFLTVMKDKENASNEDLHRIWKEIEDLSDSVAQGYVDLWDLKTVLREEYDIRV